MNQSNRLKQINDLKTFCTEFQSSLNYVFNGLNWDQNSLKESVSNEDSMVLCPFDSNHLVSNKSIDKHLKRCQMKSNGLTNEEINEIESLPESTAFYYESSPHIKPLVIDKQMEQKILGEPIDVGFCSDRWARIELSTEQRLALYNHVIQTTKEENNISILKDQSLHSLSVDLFDEMNKKLTQSADQREVETRIQMISKTRDSKRRRPSNRSKGDVHTRGRTYTEVIRQVIQNHCKTLEENFKSNQMENYCPTRKQTPHKPRIDYKSEHKHKEHRHQSQERHKRHRHQKH